MKVPQSLLERRDELRDTLDNLAREVVLHQFAHDELHGAIQVLENEPDEAEPEATQHDIKHYFSDASAAHPPASTNSGVATQRAARRDIKALVMGVLRRTPQDAKEIAKAIAAGPQSITAALEYWKAQGEAAEHDGKWHLVAKTQPAVANGPDATATAPAQQAAPPDAPMDPTQEKLVQALKAAGAAGMTDDELAKVGIPYIAVMGYHRSGLMRLESGRYHLNQTTES